MSDEEWESLCDGCGQCCVWKFEDADSNEIIYTDIRCKLFDDQSCRCMNYGHRSSLVPDCMDIRQMKGHHFPWLPKTCAYRLRFEGKPLFDWHPLISGDPASVHQSGVSMQNKTVCGEHLREEDIMCHIIDPDA